MDKGLGILIVAVIALIGGAVAAALIIRNKLSGDEIDFDEFDAMDDEEFEHFFGEERGGASDEDDGVEEIKE